MTERRRPPYHHDVVRQPAAAYGELQVGHGAEAVLQRGAAVVDDVLHREVVGCGPALEVLVPEDEGPQVTHLGPLERAPPLLRRSSASLRRY